MIKVRGNTRMHLDDSVSVTGELIFLCLVFGFCEQLGKARVFFGPKKSKSSSKLVRNEN